MPIDPPGRIGPNIAHTAAVMDIASARADPACRSTNASRAEFSVEAAPGGPDTAKAASSENFRKFEAMVLQTFIQNMLPKDGSAVYGKGMAGDMWKSMLAEKVADVMAERGGIGIADRLLGDHYSPSGEASAVADDSSGAISGAASIQSPTKRG